MKLLQASQFALACHQPSDPPHQILMEDTPSKHNRKDFRSLRDGIQDVDQSSLYDKSSWI